MRIGIVGSREFSRLDLVRARIDDFPGGVTVVSGGARGVDLEAERYAREKGLEVVVCLADWDGLGKKAGFIRNQQIVDESDWVVAFWDGKSRGTADTVKKAKAAGKLVDVVVVSGG